MRAGKTKGRQSAPFFVEQSNQFKIAKRETVETWLRQKNEGNSFEGTWQSRDGLPRGKNASGGFLIGRCTHAFGDQFDSLAPVITDLSSPASETERAQCIRWRSTVSENSGTSLAGKSQGLVPLHLVDILWAHLHLHCSNYYPYP